MLQDLRREVLGKAVLCIGTMPHYTYLLLKMSYAIFTDMESSNSCTVDFSSSPLLHRTWDNMQASASGYLMSHLQICEFQGSQIIQSYSNFCFCTFLLTNLCCGFEKFAFVEPLLFKVIFHGQIQLDRIRGIKIELWYCLTDGSVKIATYSVTQLFNYVVSW